MNRHVDGERLSAWISGDLADRDTGLVRAHVDSCATCAAAAAALGAQVVAARTLNRPEPPPTLWSSIEGALAKRETGFWSWRSLLAGALVGAAAVAVVVWGIVYQRGPIWSGGVAGTMSVPVADRIGTVGRIGGIDEMQPPNNSDPLLAEAERELNRAAAAYEQAAERLRKIFEREQALWAPEARARISDRLARLDEAVAHSRAVARRDPGDSSGADMLFSAYRRQIDFLAEAVHRDSPAASEGWR